MMRYVGTRTTSHGGSKPATLKELSSAGNIFRNDCFYAIINPDALLPDTSFEGPSPPGVPVGAPCERSRPHKAARLRAGRNRRISVALCSVSFDARFRQAP